MLSEALRLLSWVPATASLASSSYLMFLSVVALTSERRPKEATPNKTRFAILVPAHNEEAGLAETLKSLLRQYYETDLFDVYVIADNCTDRTADIAGDFPVQVFERSDPNHRGKGQALRWLIDQLIDRRDIDAFIIVDADTIVEADLLTVLDAYVQQGAAAAQVSYRVWQPDSHGLVALRALSFALVHDLKGRAKARLGLSAGLWGNGMMMTRATLQTVPWESFTSVEDAEQHIRLVLAGIPVIFAPETTVYGEMPVSFRAAKSQQQRWEGGKMALARTYGPKLLQGAARRPALLTYFAELVIPPLSLQVVFAAMTLIFAIAVGSSAWVMALGSLVALAFYVVAGVKLSRLPVRAYRFLAMAPAYMMWKTWLVLRQSRRKTAPDWIRTARER